MVKRRKPFLIGLAFTVLFVLLAGGYFPIRNGIPKPVYYYDSDNVVERKTCEGSLGCGGHAERRLISETSVESTDDVSRDTRRLDGVDSVLKQRGHRATSGDTSSESRDEELGHSFGGHKKEARNAKQRARVDTIAAFIQEISSCNAAYHSQQERQKNVLCATPETVLSYPPIDRYVISGVNNPCFFLRQGNRERGDHGWSLKLTSPNINVMDGAKTLSMYKVNCLPGVYLAGFPKSGTTELHAKLSEHHQVHGALRKEVAWLDNGKSYERFFGPGGESTFSLYAYMRMFGVASQSIENDIVRRQAELLEAELSDNDDAKPKRQGDRSRNDHDDKSLSRSVLIDSSPGNYVVEHLHKIAHLLPNSKVIFIMRDPVEREFSRYRFAFQLTKRKKFGEKFQNPESFHKYVVQQMNRTNPLRTSTSRYHIYIEAALQYFNREHLLFLMFEEFIEDPLAVIERKVLPFLGLDKYHPAVRRRMTKAMSSGSHANSSKKSYKMLYKTRILLMKYFSPFNRRLADVLGDDIWTWGY